MSKKQRGVLAVAFIMILAMVVSACTQSLSSAPEVTPTLLPTGLFVSPFPSVENPMAMIEEFAKQTAAAQTATAGGDPNVTPEAVETGTVITPQTDETPADETPTPTLEISDGTPTNAIVPASTSVPAGARPATYTLQKGEFPYCIARRYDLDPNQLLSINGLTSEQAYSLVSGTVLKIPQTGTFPSSNRALASHPTTYTVSSGDETVYSVACKYGDVEPNDIAAKNGISVSAKLTIGQKLEIP
jgi:LysM repeat protein